MKSNNRRKRKAKKTGFSKFILIVSAIVGSFLFIAGVAVFGYLLSVKDSNSPSLVQGLSKEPSGKNKGSKTDQSDTSGGPIVNMFLPPEKTNFLLIGVDQNEMLSDVIIIGCFDRDSQNIDLISVPRDTYVVIDKSDIKTLSDLGRWMPSSGVMKINAIHSYAGKEYGNTYLKKQIEKMFRIEIDYFAEINLKAFRNIVDAVGGVRMDIPSGGLHYNDPYQNLVIAVPGGKDILLDGKMAEGVVRYRKTYARGDVQRIEVQQEFMRQFFSQVINKDTIIKNAPGFLSTVINYVNTDFGIQDMPMYVKYVSSLSADKFHNHTVPGTDQTINGASYFMYDPDELAILSKEVFFSDKKPEEPAPEPTSEPKTTGKQTTTLSTDNVNYKSFKVQVLNGAQISGKAGEVANKLKDDGFKVEDVGNYTGTQREETRIVVRKTGNSEGFQQYFKQSVEEVDTNLPKSYDVVIIIGTSER